MAHGLRVGNEGGVITRLAGTAPEHGLLRARVPDSEGRAFQRRRGLSLSLGSECQHQEDGRQRQAEVDEGPADQGDAKLA